jgi:hypothetical protein
MIGRRFTSLVLVVGFMGHSALYNRLIGSTTDRLVEVAPCAVPGHQVAVILPNCATMYRVAAVVALAQICAAAIRSDEEPAQSESPNSAAARSSRRTYG